MHASVEDFQSLKKKSSSARAQDTVLTQSANAVEDFSILSCRFEH